MSLGKTLKIVNRMVEDEVIENYAIGGAVAALFYAEPTLTEDLDILVSFEDDPKSELVTLGPIVSYLENEGYPEWRHEGLVVEGWPVQFLPVSDALDLEALEQARTVDDDDLGVVTRVLTAEHLAAIALRTGRLKDLARIETLLDQDAVDLARLGRIVKEHDLSVKWAEFCDKAGISDPLAGE